MARVIQWATGGLGQAAIGAVLDHPDLELVGAWVHSPAKVGVDLGELIGREPVGVRASGDVEALLALDADCVLYSPLMADTRVVRAILASGKNVVTPLGWFYPRRAERERYDEICRAAGVTLHGTGIHPGGITERLPLVISALSGSVTSVRAEEFSDIRTYAAPEVVRDWMLFGATPEQAAGSPMVKMLEGGYSQSVWMVADELGFDLDPDLRVTHDVAVATAPIDSPIGPIAPGHVAAQRYRWQGTVDGEPVVTAAVNWFMGEEHLDPAWAFGPLGQRYEIEITGDPGSMTTFTGMHGHGLAAAADRNPGLVATAMHCVNAIPYVVAAPPGVRTYLDLPPVAGRAAAPLHRARRSRTGTAPVADDTKGLT
ncbi:NAD(P)H-dependent amine dehydrogenase family protein [Nocardia bovistercoris]|uniref:Dihydrodipicolinate reductase n=1 Tax=Nocardia bovistercoris TaxID=2785916 RepID=A0A931N344_9NOCA|nr:dihydrodipicolinate reductase [Nocardia bovistercoris]MBH0780215.1 dihydrodipicolinate reductase [Nocardia bovistercoris]